MEQLKLELATKKAKQLFIRDERDRDRWDRYTHETKAEARFSVPISKIVEQLKLALCTALGLRFETTTSKALVEVR